MPNVRYQPKDDYDANEMYVSGIGGAAEVVLNLIFLPAEVTSANRWARLGVLQRVLEQGGTAPRAAIMRAQHDIIMLREDKAWLGTWPEPKKIRQVLSSLALETEKLRRTKPHLLHRETLFPPRVLAALQAEKADEEER